MNHIEKSPLSNRINRTVALGAALLTSVGFASEARAARNAAEKPAITPLSVLESRAEKRIQRKQPVTVLNGTVNLTDVRRFDNGSIGEEVSYTLNPIIVKRKETAKAPSLQTIKSGYYALGSISLASGKPEVDLEIYRGQRNSIIEDNTIDQPFTEKNTLVTGTTFNPNDEKPDYMYALNAGGQLRMNPEISNAAQFVPATPVIIADKYISTGK